MCNLWSSRVFLIPNPCCCCLLRCGAVWTGIIDFLYGGISLLVPVAVGVWFEQAKLTFSEGTTYWNNNDPHVRSFISYGCHGIQSVTGLYLAISIRCIGGPFQKFMAGCLWLAGRAIVTVAWVQFLYAILGESGNLSDPTWRTYVYLLTFNLVIHVYFFIVVRYYTMEAYDIWKYKPIQSETSKPGGRQRREVAPLKNKKHPHKRQEIRLAEERKSRRQVESGQLQQHRHPWEDAPVWRCRDDFVFYGENYSHWDPEKFFRQWERLARTGILKLGDKNQIKDEELQKIIVAEAGSSMQLLEIVDEKSKPSKQASAKKVEEPIENLPEPVVGGGSASEPPPPKKTKYSIVSAKKGKHHKKKRH